MLNFNAKILFYVLAVSRFSLANYLNVMNVVDPVANQALVQLISNKTLSLNDQEQLTSSGLRALLLYLSPEIKVMSGYTGQFLANCSIFMNTHIEEVLCDVMPASTVSALSGYPLNPSLRLPVEYGLQITRSNILLVNIFADWTGKTMAWLEQYVLGAFGKMATCTQTASASETSTLTALPSSGSTKTLTATQSVSFSNSKTTSSTQLATPSLTASASKSLVISLSPTGSGTRSDSKSFSSMTTATASASLPVSLTDSVSLSRSLSLSQSLSQSGSGSSSSSQSSSYSLSNSSSPVCSSTVPPTTGLLSAWSGTTGVYADATNQPNRYTVSNGVVTDTLTNIQWEQTAGTGTMIWSSVSSYCAARTTGGMTDWRVPNIVELGTLVDYTIAYNTAPQINLVAFPGAPASNFWSASSDIGNSGNSWFLGFSSYADSSYEATSTPNQVRCVRSCYLLPPSSSYTVASGEVTDSVTGLIWQQVSTGSTMTQANAVTHCTGLGFNGHIWRLPMVRELQTLVDYSANYGTLMMNTTVFAGEPAGYFWSSTLMTADSGGAWGVYFGLGYLDNYNAATSLCVRCVR